MSDLPSVSGKDAIKAFEKIGFAECRTSGSHFILKRDGHRLNLSVPCHGNTALKPGTLRGLIKAAGITVEEFRALL